MTQHSKTKLKSVPRGHTPRRDTTSTRAAHSVAKPKRWFDERILWWIVLAALLAVTWFAYHLGLTSGWFLDDYGNIVNNGALALPNLSFSTLWHAVWSFNAGPLGRPISLATFAIERYFYGLNPYVFKATNLALHLVTTVLIAGFTRSLLGVWRTRFAPDTKASHVEWIALAIAAATAAQQCEHQAGHARPYGDHRRATARNPGKAPCRGRQVDRSVPLPLTADRKDATSQNNTEPAADGRGIPTGRRVLRCTSRKRTDPTL
jgi:hypothetical protein